MTTKSSYVPSERLDASTSKASSDTEPELEPDLQTLLDQFSQAAQPTSSRVNHEVAQTPVKPVGLFSSWRYVGFLASQGRSFTSSRGKAAPRTAAANFLANSAVLLFAATKVASATVSHAVYGPAKPSWGLEMT